MHIKSSYKKTQQQAANSNYKTPHQIRFFLQITKKEQLALQKARFLQITSGQIRDTAFAK